MATTTSGEYKASTNGEKMITRVSSFSFYNSNTNLNTALKMFKSDQHANKFTRPDCKSDKYN